MNKGRAMCLSQIGALGAALMGVSSITSSVFAANLVKNGDFANLNNVWVNNTPYGGDDIQTTGGTNIPDWTNTANFANETWIEPNSEYGVAASPGNGSGYLVDLTGQANSKPYGGIEQRITTVPGMGYRLTFDLGGFSQYNGSGTAAAALIASAKGDSVLASHSFFLNITTNSQWATKTLTFIADSDRTTIKFLGDSDYTSEFTGLDNVVMETRLLATSTSLTVSPPTATAGSSVSLTALVRPSEGSVTPTGKVEFKSGSTTLGSASLNGTGQATYTTVALAVGKDPVTAKYSGDSIHNTSSSEAVTVTISAGPAITLSSTSLTFGAESTEKSSAAKTVTIKNGGNTTVSLKSISLTGGQADDFALTNSCGAILAAKASCMLSVTFKPVSTGAKVATIDISDSAGGSPQTVALSGTGTSGDSAPSISLSPTSLSFGSEKPGSASSAKIITVMNTGSAALSLKSLQLAGGESDDFVITTTCGTSLAAKATCKVTVTFKPVSAGAKVAHISISDKARGSPQTVALSGTGS